MLNSCNGHQQAVGTWVQMWAACVELLEGWHTFITSYSSSLPMLTEPWPNKPPRNIKLLSQHAAVRSRMCRPRRGQPITLKKNFEGNSIAGLRERRKTQCCVMQQNSQWRAGPATPASFSSTYHKTHFAKSQRSRQLSDFEIDSRNSKRWKKNSPTTAVACTPRSVGDILTD